MRIIPDKSWIDIPRFERSRDNRYKDGLKAFIQYADANPRKLESGRLYCPCCRCRNDKLVDSSDIVHKHLLQSGFDDKYKYWDFHGEGCVDELECATERGVHSPRTLIGDCLADHITNDTFHFEDVNAEDVNVEDVEEVPEIGDIERLMQFVEDNKNDLYDGCSSFTRLSFLLRLLHIKTLSGMATQFFEMLLDLLRKVIPTGEKIIPKTFYEVKKIIATLGLDYKKIDACPNDCILYYKVNEHLEECPKCGLSRWIQHTQNTSKTVHEKKVPAKVLRHFPLVPRLQRLYMTEDTAKDMKWHKEGRTNDGKLRHPADSDAWKHVDNTYPLFARECRNVRLGLATDGFNPFGLMSSGWSTWPVIVMPYNLPPGLCMKRSHMMLSLLIPGKHSPGNDIDVFLEPLIDELKQLWTEGVVTYDAHSKQLFRLHAVLLWTINDFPAYANLSGWSTKGTYACPVCSSEYAGIRLQYSRKCCYWFNRRWLPRKHKYRKWSNKFDGTVEIRGPPRQLSGDEIVNLLQQYPNVRFGKNRFSKDDFLRVRLSGQKKKAPKRKRQVVEDNDQTTDKLPKGWTKFSIFYQLPYWQKLLIRHNLDPMHTEKNICDNLLSTLLQDAMKSKDDLRARQDLTALNIRDDLHARDIGNNKFELPSSRITMTKTEMQRFCEVIKSVKSPDGYASNISNKVQVQERKILGLKTHDYHVLLHQLLPMALRKNMDKEVAKVIIEFCGFFRKLCSKVVDVHDFKVLATNMSETLCKMELFFPPSFFTIMVHLSQHLANECIIAGPVNYRWMYPIERYLGWLKNLVRNRARPEASIAEGYVANECMEFASRFIRGAQSRQVPDLNTDTNVHGTSRMISDYSRFELEQAHTFILNNLEIFEEYRTRHLTELEKEIIGPSAAHDIAKKHMQEFPEWVKSYVKDQELAGVPISNEIKKHAEGPYYAVNQYRGYHVNGYLFHTIRVDEKRVTQNSGVMALFSQNCFSSSRDQNPVIGEIIYYGQVEDIIELFYAYGLKDQCSYVMFKVRWCHSEKNKDEFEFNLVNLNKEIYKNEKLMFASQADQCFYVRDPTNPNVWVVLYKEPKSIVLPTNNEDDVDDDIDNDDIEPVDNVWQDFTYPQDISFNIYAPRTRVDIPNVEAGVHDIVRNKKNKTASNLARIIQTRSRARSRGTSS